MTSEEPELVAGKLYQPQRVENGTVRYTDTGFERTIVLKVERDGEVFYETYELVSVDREEDLES